MSCRGFIRCVAALALAQIGSGEAAVAAAAPASALRDDLFGVYELEPGHHIGINRFINDAGDTVALFADYRTGVVRRLYADSLSEFVMGPSSAAREPVEMHARFALETGGATTLTLQPVGGNPVVARRVHSREQEVTFGNGDAKLAGTLILPVSRGPHPAIILLHGSGPLTRHSFGPYPNFFASLGLAVLIFDKRGGGESTGIRLDASTGASAPLPKSFYPDVLVEDALAAFRLLQRHPDIDTSQIGLWGSSEGGMLATQVAAQNQDVAFAINSSGFAGPLWETLLYQAGAIPKSSGHSEQQAQDARAFAALWLQVARTGKNFDLFVARRDAARKVEDWMLSYFSGAYSSVEQMRWDWDHILSFDSTLALARVKCPVLGVFGGKDPLTDAPVAARNMREALARAGNPDFTFRIFPDGSHSLTELPSKSRMAPGLFDTLSSWLRERVRGLPRETR